MLTLQGDWTAANALAALASKNSRDATYESPYSKEAIQQGLDVPWYEKVLGKKLVGKSLFQQVFPTLTSLGNMCSSTASIHYTAAYVH